MPRPVDVASRRDVPGDAWPTEIEGDAEGTFSASSEAETFAPLPAQSRETALVSLEPAPLDEAAAAQPRPHRDGHPHAQRPRLPSVATPRVAGSQLPANPHSERSPGPPICTAPQLRRFIKSRAYVPMHELRRRFAIEGADDDVTGIALDSGLIFVGLPGPESRLLGDLVRSGEIGIELSIDPQTPVVVGVYAMRPIPRA